MDLVTTWRLITEDGVTDTFGLAGDEALAGCVGQGRCEPTLRLYTYLPCALVGRFQTVANEVHIGQCRAAGVPINRRPTGGGAIVMGADQLGVALTLPGTAKDAYSRARDMMVRFSAGLVAALHGMGIDAEFRGKNDVEVAGRKIAGLGIFRHSSGGLLFHASLLVDLDVAHMLKVLNTPFEKITGKEIATVAARASTVRKELGRAISLDEVRDRVAEGYGQAFQVTLEPGAFTERERDAIAILERKKYATEAWVHQHIDLPDAFGSARKKTPAGLLDIRVTLAGRMVKAVFIGGDFFAAEGAVAELERVLRWHSARPGAIEGTLRGVFDRRGRELEGIPAAELVETVQMAVLRASQTGAREQMNLYGCFVDPRGA